MSNSDISILLQQAKEQGKTIVGVYCAYAPLELILAAGALSFSLCASKEDSIVEAEKTLPRNLCPLIKSSYGLAISGQCPYFRFSDLVVGETTCDGKKKMFEILQTFKPVHVMKLPKSYSDTSDKTYWLAEINKLKTVLETTTGVKITAQALQTSIKILNKERRLMQQLAGFMKLDPTPLSGQDLLKLLSGRNYVFDRSDFAKQLEETIACLEEAVAAGDAAFPRGTKRILITGVPTGPEVDKVIRVIEECGGAVVYIESCSGMKLYSTLVDETKPPLEAIAEKYLTIPCSCMSPNPLRLEQFGALISDYQLDGVVDIIWHWCHSYNVESRVLENHLKQDHGLPFFADRN